MVKRIWVWILVAVVVTASATSAIWWIIVGFKPTGVGYVAVMELSGVISYEESPIALTGAPLTPEKVEKMVEEVRGDPSAKAVVLLIDSPGGSAAASEEIYQTLKRLAGEKPTISYIAEYGASGGYHIALAGEEIIASPSSLTGSIGAVSVSVNIAELAERLGLEAETFKSGRLKDVGSIWRRMTPEEKELMQRLVDDVAGIFEERVREERGDKIKDWDDVLTARPYLGIEAAEIGLVDRVGGLEDAIARARELAGLPSTAPYRRIKPRAPSLLELLFGGAGGGGGRMKLSYEVLLMWPPPAPIEPYEILGSSPRRG